jgi:hypothetical protein
VIFRGGSGVADGVERHHRFATDGTSDKPLRVEHTGAVSNAKNPRCCRDEPSDHLGQPLPQLISNNNDCSRSHAMKFYAIPTGLDRAGQYPVCAITPPEQHPSIYAGDHQDRRLTRRRVVSRLRRRARRRPRTC